MTGDIAKGHHLYHIGQIKGCYQVGQNFVNVVLVIFCFTVKLAHKDQPKDKQNVVLIHRWSFYAGSVAWKVYIWGTVYCLYKQVVFMHRWSLEQI